MLTTTLHAMQGEANENTEPMMGLAKTKAHTPKEAEETLRAWTGWKEDCDAPILLLNSAVTKVVSREEADYASVVSTRPARERQ